MQQPLLAIPISFVLVLISMAFGRKMLSLLRVQTDSSVEKSIFGLGLGLGILAYLVLAVGLLRFLYSYVLIAVVIVMGLIAVNEIRGMLREIVVLFRENMGAKLATSDSLIMLSTVSIGALALICALAPPASMDWDGLAYHLAVPKLYLRHHSIYYVAFTSHSNFPFLTEMLYTIGLSIGSIGAAKLFHFSMYIGTALALYSLGTRHVNGTVGKLAALIFMSVPVVFYEAGVAYADITMGFYILLAVYAMLNWQETRNTRWLMVCSVMCGFALGTKVLTAVPIFAICLLILMSSAREGNWGRGFKLGLFVGLGGILIGSVWYIKAYVYTGNPFYPFLYSIFGGRNWSVEAARTYQAEQSSFGMGKGIAQLFLLPWHLLADGTKFTNKASANVFAAIGPVFIGLIPVYVLRGKLNRAVWQISVVAAIFLLAWFGLMQHSRYLITVVPLLSIIAAAGADAGLRGSKIGRAVVVAFLSLTVLLAIYAGSVLAMLNFRPAFGLESQEEYLTKNLDVYEAESYIDQNLPSDAKIVLFDEVRGFYLDRDYIWGNPGHHELIPWKSFKTDKDMVRWFKEHGYTHMLLNRMFGSGRFPYAIGHGLMKEVYSTNTCTVYEFGG